MAKNINKIQEQCTIHSVSGSGFISEPKNIEELENNAHFQFDNVSGWMSVKDYECALIKARYLVEALEKLVKQSAY